MLFDLISAFIGICFIIGSIVKSRENHYLAAHGIKVTGMVYTLNQVKRNYYPVVRFRTKEDIWVTKQLDFGSCPPLYAEGDPVELLYDPEDPEIVILISEATLSFLPLVFGLAGLILVVLVVLSLLDVI